MTSLDMTAAERLRLRLSLRRKLDDSHTGTPLSRFRQVTHQTASVEFKDRNVMVERRDGRYYASGGGFGRWGRDEAEARRNLARAGR